MQTRSSGPPFEINDGVRRAKAFELTGRISIPAIIDGAGPSNVAIDDLRVPRGNVSKHVVDITSERAEERWLDTFIRTRNAERPPPIDVRSAPQSDGVPIAKVPVVKRGQVVDPFTGESK